MNYRHIYHAGNFADVMKHATLCLIADHLKAKDKPFYALDTHAGIGRYDLRAEEAQKTGEYRAGIARLLDEPKLPPELAGYVAAVAALNGTRKLSPRGLHWYPGSPRILRAALRPGDRLDVCELHPADAGMLAREFAGDRQVTVHRMDGYQALKAFLPPAERRGLVVVDPPFEERDEFAKLAAGLRQAHRRWATGTYALWYPIKARRPVDAFLDEIAASGIRKVAVAELLVHPGDDPERFNGCGLVLVNPPWRLVEQVQALLGFLAPRLGQDGTGVGGGRWRAEWLVGE
jgi:23S rRNA (adenine2030-N6)-methyltransferase